MLKYKTHVRYNTSGRLRRPVEETLSQLLSEYFQNNPGPILIAVGGPGGTGKSTICQQLMRLLPESAVLTLDDYKTPRAVRQSKNLYGAHPEANEMALIKQHLQNIRDDESFEQPVYDAVKGTIETTRPFQPKRFTILDGEISTYKEFRDLVDFSIFLDSDWKTQLATRISRDIEVRQYTQEKAIATFLQSNLREFAEFGKESKRWADLHLYCKDDYSVIIESVATEIYDAFTTVLTEELAAVDLAGLVVPVATPFKENLEIDRQALIRHIEFLAENGVERILMNGTVGEFFSLSLAERKQLLTISRRYFPGVVFFHAGSTSLAQTETEVRWAEEYGADAVLALPPFYYANVGEQGLIDYFETLHEHLEIPLILYNFSRHTQNPLTESLLKSVSHFGLKDSDADLSLIPFTPHYYLGSDTGVVEAFQAGAHGFISGSANFLPERYVALERDLQRGAGGAAQAVQDDIDAELTRHMIPNGVVRIKAAIAATLPAYPSRVRPPLRG